MADFALGGLAGSFAEMAVLPSLTVRTRMMIQGADSNARQYTSFAQCFRSIVREEGVGAFYKGAGINFAFTPLARGLYTVGMESTKTAIGDGTPIKDFAAGMGAQLLSSFAYVPRDIMLERCAVDGHVKNDAVGSSASSLATLRTIMSHEGLMGFYRAYIPHQLVWVPYNGLFFSFLVQQTLE